MAAVLDSAVLLSSYRMVMQGALVRMEASAQPVGRFAFMHGRTVQCVCRLHTNCRLMANYKSLPELKFFECLMNKWLILGTATDAATHGAKAKDLQTQWRVHKAEVASSSHG